MIDLPLDLGGAWSAGNRDRIIDRALQHGKLCAQFADLVEHDSTKRPPAVPREVSPLELKLYRVAIYAYARRREGLPMPTMREVLYALWPEIDPEPYVTTPPSATADFVRALIETIDLPWGDK